MALLRLPNELLLLVTSYLVTQKDINSLARTTTLLYDVLDAYLYRYNVERDKCSALLWASENGQEVTAKKSVAAGANVNARAGPDRMPLSRAAYYGHIAIVKMLLSTKGVEPDAPNSRGDSPLSLAARNGQYRVVRLLLATRGVNPNARNLRQETPLCLAAWGGYDEVVKLLLVTNGVDPCARNSWGETPLSLAAGNG
jgi:ankyrin repeat protein